MTSTMQSAMTSTTLPNMKAMAIVLYPDFEPLEVFGVAGMIGTDLGGTQCYDIHFFMHGKDDMQSQMSPAIEMLCPSCKMCTMEEGMKLRSTWDVVMVPGGKGYANMMYDQRFMDVLRQLCVMSEKVFTVCTGSLLLAKTGLLHGMKATTKKEGMKKLIAEFPMVKWIEVARWTDDDKYMCSSGVCAGMVTVSWISDV